MPWSYRKSRKIGPFRVSASKRGIGYSVGKSGFRVGKRAGGRRYTSASKRGFRNTQSCAMIALLFLGLSIAVCIAASRKK